MHGRILIDDLIDGGHHAHVHHDLDDFGGLDRHLLRELAHRHGLADRHLAHHARGRHLEAVLGIRIAAASIGAARRADFFFLCANSRRRRCAAPGGRSGCALSSASRRRTSRLRRAVRCGGLALASRPARRGLRLGLARRASSSAVRLRFSSSLRRRFSSSSALAVQPLLLEPLVLGALDGGLRLLLALARTVDLFLLVPRLILENLALHVGALAAHFHVDGSRATLGARELQLRCDLRRRVILRGAASACTSSRPWLRAQVRRAAHASRPR